MVDRLGGANARTDLAGDLALPLDLGANLADGVIETGRGIFREEIRELNPFFVIRQAAIARFQFAERLDGGRRSCRARTYQYLKSRMM